MFNDWGSSNTIDPDFRDAISSGQNVEVSKTVDVDMITLGSLFAEYVGDKEIDLLNIDIESVDYAALSGNDWDIFRPKVIAIEDLNFNLERPSNSSIYSYLKPRGYSLEARAVYTSIFVAAEAREYLKF